MRSAAASASRASFPGWLGVGGLALALVVGSLQGPALAEGWAAWPRHAAVAFGIYGLAHLVRIVRSLVVLGGGARSVREVAIAHLASAAWSGLMPLKVGEIVRMYALGRTTTGLWQGVRVVWVERTFDAVLLSGAALAAIATLPGAAAQVAPVLLLSALLLVVTLVAIIALPENLMMVKHWVLRRYTSGWSLRLLAVLDELLEGVRALRSLVAGKVATLGLLTLAIWSLEVLGLWALLPAAGRPGGGADAAPAHLLVGLLAVLSDGLRLDGPLYDDGLGAALAGWRTIVFVTLAAMAPLSVVVGLLGGSVAPVRRR